MSQAIRAVHQAAAQCVILNNMRTVMTMIEDKDTEHIMNEPSESDSIKDLPMAPSDLIVNSFDEINAELEESYKDGNFDKGGRPAEEVFADLRKEFGL